MWTYFFTIFESVIIHFINIIIPVFGLYMAIRLVSDLAFKD